MLHVDFNKDGTSWPSWLKTGHELQHLLHLMDVLPPLRADLARRRLRYIGHLMRDNQPSPPWSWPVDSMGDVFYTTNQALKGEHL